MIFGKTFKEKDAAYAKWLQTKIFILWPKQLRNGQYVWLQKIRRDQLIINKKGK